MRVYLYGSGNRCKTLLELVGLSDVIISGIVDSNPDRCGAWINGYEINVLCKFLHNYACLLK